MNKIKITNANIAEILEYVMEDVELYSGMVQAYENASGYPWTSASIIVDAIIRSAVDKLNQRDNIGNNIK